MSNKWIPDTWEDLCMALYSNWEKNVWCWFDSDPLSLEKFRLIDKIKSIAEYQGDLEASLQDPRTKE